jgi:hypothetical protein
MMRGSKDFIIKGGQSTTNVGGGGSSILGQQRKILGMNKPHMLAKQNELIQQMLDKERSAAGFSQTVSSRPGGSHISSKNL